MTRKPANTTMAVPMPTKTSVLAANALVCVVGTALPLVWLICSGEKTEVNLQGTLSRAALERAYITNSMSFYVGGIWLALMQDLFIPVGVFVDQNLLPAEAPTGLGLGYTVVLFCPILTVLVFWKQSAVLNALGRLLDVDVPQVSAENVKTLRSGSKMHMSATASNCGRGPRV